MTNATNEYSFTCLPIVKGEKNTIKEIVSSIYKDNMQVKRKKDLSTFYKVDLPLLWFFNIVGCCRHLVFACFADDSIFGSHVPDISGCDNYFYSIYKGVNMGDDSDVPN